jgi:hypothetical protein
MGPRPPLEEAFRAKTHRPIGGLLHAQTKYIYIYIYMGFDRDEESGYQQHV